MTRKRTDAAAVPSTVGTLYPPSFGSNQEARVLEVGSRVAGNAAYYPDVDMVAPAGGKPALYARRDGTPYTDLRRRGPEDC